jgi:uncharacterized protein
MLYSLSPRYLLLFFGLCIGFLLATEMVPAALVQSDPCTNVTVANIQGSGNTSPLADARGKFCTTACVTGIAAEGFFIQSTTPDANPDTSEGVYVYRYPSWQNPRQLKAGNLIHIAGFRVQEFYGQTEMVKLADDKKSSYQVVGPCALPDPVAIPMLSDPHTDPQDLYERYEAMRVSLALDASVTGPTQRYVSRFPAGDPEITLVDRDSSFYGRLISAEHVPNNRLTLALSGGLDVELPDVGVLDRVTATRVTGILAFQFGRYILLVEDSSPLRVEKAAFRTAPRVIVKPDEFAACTYNVMNLFDHVDDSDGDVGDWSPEDARAYQSLVVRQAMVIREHLSGCNIIGLQEIEGKDAVWEALARAAGPQYRFDYWESQDVRDITVGILYDTSRVEVWHSQASQACTPVDYGVSYAAARGSRAAADPCPPGQFPLFDRAPYIADLAVRSGSAARTFDVRFIVTHLKSKRGDEAENEPRRMRQAGHVASLMTERLTLAVGDINDTLGSATLEAFEGLVNVYDRHVAPPDRYSYNYQGRTEAIDHIIMTPALDRYFLRGGPIHVNADFPETRSVTVSGGRRSDHDPMVAQFAFLPTGVTEGLHGLITGVVSPP